MSKKPAILVTCYVNPDLDGYAGAVAYAEFLQKQGQDVIARVVGDPHEEVKYVLDRFALQKTPLIDNDEQFSEVILVDASDLGGLEDKICPDKVIEIIDHRKVHEADKFPRAKAQIELVGAAATLIAEKFMTKDLSISPRSAILLYSAIISNTLNFQGGVTTERDRVASDWLRRFLDVPDSYWRELFLAKSNLVGNKLASRLDSDFASFELGGRKIGIAQLEIIGAADLLRERAEELAILLPKMKEELSLDLIFLNAIELENQKNYFVSYDEAMKDILEAVLNIKFSGPVAEREGLIMRKQIVPLIKEKLESK